MQICDLSIAQMCFITAYKKSIYEKVATKNYSCMKLEKQKSTLKNKPSHCYCETGKKTHDCALEM